MMFKHWPWTPAWKRTEDYRRWKAGLPSEAEERLATPSSKGE